MLSLALGLCLALCILNAQSGQLCLLVCKLWFNVIYRSRRDNYVLIVWDVNVLLPLKIEDDNQIIIQITNAFKANKNAHEV